MTSSHRSFQEEHNAAIEACLMAMVQALHKRGALPADAFVAQLKETDAFARAAHNRPKNEVLSVLIGAFEQLAEALKK